MKKLLSVLTLLAISAATLADCRTGNMNMINDLNLETAEDYGDMMKLAGGTVIAGVSLVGPPGAVFGGLISSTVGPGITEREEYRDEEIEDFLMANKIINEAYVGDGVELRKMRQSLGHEGVDSSLELMSELIQEMNDSGELCPINNRGKRIGVSTSRLKKVLRAELENYEAYLQMEEEN